MHLPTGVITSQVALDFETGPIAHALTITADDGVQPPIVDTLVVNILDVYEEHVVVNLPNTITVDVKAVLCPTDQVILIVIHYRSHNLYGIHSLYIHPVLLI